MPLVLVVPHKHLALPERLMPLASSVSTSRWFRSSMTQRSVTKHTRRWPCEAEGKVISSILMAWRVARWAIPPIDNEAWYRGLSAPRLFQNYQAQREIHQKRVDDVIILFGV